MFFCSTPFFTTSYTFNRLYLTPHISVYYNLQLKYQKPRFGCLLRKTRLSINDYFNFHKIVIELSQLTSKLFSFIWKIQHLISGSQ
jgi:hypothetical protein